MITLLLLFQIRLISQVFDMRFNHLTKNDGLTHNSIQKIVRDSTGYIWIATEDGLNKYNGYKLVNFFADPSDSNSIISNFLAEECFCDSEGNMWFSYGRENGISRYKGDEIFHNYKFVINDSIKAFGTRQLIEDKNKNIWVPLESTAKEWIGLAKINLLSDKIKYYLNKEIISETIRSRIVKLFTDSLGKVWILTTNGLYFYTNGLFEKVDFSYNKLLPTYFYNIIENSKDKYLLSTNNGLYQFNLSTNSLKKIELDDIKDHDNVECFYKDKSSRIWISFRKSGLYSFVDNKFVKHKFINKSEVAGNEDKVRFYESDGNTWIYETQSPNNLFFISDNGNRIYNSKRVEILTYSLSDDKISSITSSADGTIFIGTENGGVNIYNPYKNSFQWLIHEKSLSNSLTTPTVRSIRKDNKGNFVFSLNSDGIDFYTEDFKKIKNITPKLVDGEKLVLTEYHPISTDSLIVGTQNTGLFILDLETERQMEIKLDNLTHKYANKDISAIYKDNKNNYWIGTIGGLYVLNSKFEQIKSFDLFEYGYIKSITEFNDNVILGSIDGIVILNFENGVIKHYKQFQDKFSIIFRTIFVSSDDKIYATTYENGFTVIDTKNDSIKYYNKTHGIASNTIACFEEDNKGNIWIVTEIGLSCFNPKTEKIKNYNIHDGLPGSSMMRAILKDSTGFFYVGAENGVFRFNPEQILENLFPPQLHFTSNFILDKKNKTEHEIKTQNNIELSYYDNVFSFEYVGLNFAAPNKTQYEYKMEGLNENWINVGTQRKVTLMNVPHGEYIFRVRAINENGYFEPKGASIKLSIHPPFWATIWFNMLMIIFFLSGIYGLYWYRVRNLKKIEKIRWKIAGDLHDEIGSNLGSIAMMSKVLKRKNNPDMLDKIYETSLKTSSSIRDIVWFIRPENDDFQKIIYRMKSFCEDTLGEINYCFSMGNEEIFEKLNLEEKRNIYLILKEAVHNVVKHSHAKNASIEITIKNKKFRMVIADDGKGFNSANDMGNGIRNLKKRAKEINGKLDITSKVDWGTKISLEINGTIN